MKKFISLLLVLLLLVSLVTGCSTKKQDENVSSSDTAKTDEYEDDYEDDEYDDEYTDDEYEDEDDSEDNYDDSEEDNYDDSDDYDDSYDDYDDSEEDYYEDADNGLSEAKRRANAVKDGEDEAYGDSALSKTGNLTRLAAAIRKSQAGKEVVIVYYGGVNFNRASHTVPDVYAMEEFADYWRQNIGPCKTIQLGELAFTSTQACLRVDQDVLSQNPDLVFLDFAVQDNFEALAKNNSIAFDNLVRKIANHSSKPAVVTILSPAATLESYTVNPKNPLVFKTAASYEKKVSEYYDFPVIDFETAFWDILFDLVEVTEKTEIPLILFSDVMDDNMTLSGVGQKLLYSHLVALVRKTTAQLNKIPKTKNTVKTVGYFKVDDFMNASFASVKSIVNGTAKGYKFDLDFKDKVSQHGYTFIDNNASISLTANSIRTYRHYKAPAGATEAMKDKEVDPHFLEIAIPEIKANEEAYFAAWHTAAVKPIWSNEWRPDFDTPISIYCYDKNNKFVGHTVCYGQPVNENAKGSVYRHLKIPTGTTRIVFKCYTSAGTIEVLGVGRFVK